MHAKSHEITWDLACVECANRRAILLKHNRLNDNSQASIPAKWFRKNDNYDSEAHTHE